MKLMISLMLTFFSFNVFASYTPETLKTKDVVDAVLDVGDTLASSHSSVCSYERKEEARLRKEYEELRRTITDTNRLRELFYLYMNKIADVGLLPCQVKFQNDLMQMMVDKLGIKNR